MQPDAMNLRELLRYATRKLSFSGVDTPMLDSHLLLCKAAGITRTDIIAHPDVVPDSETVGSFLDWVDRRCAREPLAYIVGEKGFYGIPLKVTPAVLIPRPETELLVEYCLEFLKGKNSPVVADIGCGSGAIAISVAKSMAGCVVYAVDISREAIDVARENVQASSVTDRVRLLLGDLLHPLEGRKCDLIVSNPPYIPSAVIGELEPEVSVYEPRMALDGGVDGLGLYQRLVDAAAAHLNPGGALAVEIGLYQSETVAAMFDHSGFEGIRVIPDYAGINRIVSGVLG